MKWIKEFSEWIIIPFILVVSITTFVIQPTEVLGSSMEPTLHNEDRVYISKISHTLNYEPDYGDIVIIDSHINSDHTLKEDIIENPIISLIYQNQDHNVWIKRVVGKSGDTLEFKDNKVYRNGKLLEEPYIKEAMLDNPDRTVVVPENHVFVMGDNRNNSSDSRIIGCVPLDHILGKRLF
ncbi:signal peptidase I [Aneurinibacillus uraniidurans]|uniref:signal peptidase I n=1 Tax=Aneurinibacillus uraniidurans TaxID=2966586 RepID=UPI0023497E4E|nr:signal peptidase I [Aneurinibacillus sp. B1]WCN39350.1 signal peptidase I [Aneurinibacillus sp. B1]